MSKEQNLYSEKCFSDEVIDENEYTLFDEKSPWKRKTITNYTVRKMLHQIFKDGELVNKAVGAYPKEKIIELLEI